MPSDRPQDEFKVNIARSATATQGEAYTYGVQFIDLKPEHYALLQNLTYEAPIADRQKIAWLQGKPGVD